MTIPNKREVTIVLVGLAAMFAFGRYSVSTKPDVKVVETTKSDTKSEEKKDTHVVTHETIKKEPKGTVTTEITTTTDIVSHNDTDIHLEDTKTTQETKQSRAKTNISLIAAKRLSDLGSPLYGISAQKEFIGPVTVGIFALTDSTVGVSIGFNF